MKPRLYTSKCVYRAFSTTTPRLGGTRRLEKRTIIEEREAAERAKYASGSSSLEKVVLEEHPLWRNKWRHADMQPLEPQSISTERIGKAFSFSLTKGGPLNVFGVPRTVEKDFAHKSSPFSIVRQVTIDLKQLVDEAKSQEQGPRIVLTGERGNGKSFLLLQTLSYCHSTDWIVLYVPTAVNFVNNTTAYHYDARTQTFHQPSVSAALLRRLLKTDHKGLKEILLKEDIFIEKDNENAPKAGAPLRQAIQYGLRELSVAPLVLEHVLGELAQQKQYPFLIAVDDFQALYCKSLYKTPQFLPIQAYHLSVPRLLLEYASGLKPINHGAFIGAIGLTDTHFTPSIELVESLGLTLADTRPPGSYDKRSPDYQLYAKGLKNFAVPNKLSTLEASGLYNTWVDDQALHTGRNDRAFMAKFAETSGNAREFVFKGLLATLSS